MPKSGTNEGNEKYAKYKLTPSFLYDLCAFFIS